MLKGDLLEAEVWRGFQVAMVGLRVGDVESGKGPQMVKREERVL